MRAGVPEASHHAPVVRANVPRYRGIAAGRSATASVASAAVAHLRQRHVFGNAKHGVHGEPRPTQQPRVLTGGIGSLSGGAQAQQRQLTVHTTRALGAHGSQHAPALAPTVHSGPRIRAVHRRDEAAPLRREGPHSSDVRHGSNTMGSSSSSKAVVAGQGGETVARPGGGSILGSLRSSLSNRPPPAWKQRATAGTDSTLADDMLVTSLDEQPGEGAHSVSGGTASRGGGRGRVSVGAEAQLAAHSKWAKFL